MHHDRSEILVPNGPGNHSPRSRADGLSCCFPRGWTGGDRAMTGTPLPGVLAPLGPLLDHYGYLAVAGLIIVEDFGVPAPGETVLIAAAVYAGAGRLNIWRSA